MLVKRFSRLLVLLAAPVVFLAGFALVHHRGWDKSLRMSTTSFWFHDKIGENKLARIELVNDWRPMSDGLSTTHTEIFSHALTHDGRYFTIDFGQSDNGMNPSVLPHPLTQNWLVVAQHVKNSSSSSIWFSELVCEAAFEPGGRLACLTPPKILPIAPTVGDGCVGELDYFAFNIGPHDARVFYGPDHPYVVYGSNSVYTCFGQWIQDFRPLVDWEAPVQRGDYFFAEELRRPGTWGAIEKNWFLFWDGDDQPYVHHNIFPQRTFARLGPETITADLSVHSSEDAACLAATLPSPRELESIHQATNSLSITWCQRADKDCADNAETYILTIVQHKTFYSFHSVYEPYVVLFKQTAPFAIYAISSKPIWIHGRQDQTEMLYVTSISWASHNQTYHGHLDDVLFISFGIEDSRSGAIDVLAADLLRDLSLCRSDFGRALQKFRA